MRDERARTEEGLRRKALILSGVLVLSALVVGSLFGDRGILQLLRQQQRAEALLQELEELRTDNRRLAAEIVALRTDQRAVERLAREELGLGRAGEMVFLIRAQRAAERQ